MRAAAIAAAGAVASAAAVAAAGAYALDMRRAYGRIRERGTVVPSPYGDIEYTEAGSGAPALVIHGSGGGHDQGELVAEAVLGGGFRCVTPSRFGYLRSTFREGATWDDQAHAYACLLDHLGIEKAAVVALSHGGPSALLLAALHPERVSSLTLLSCGVAASDSPDQAQASRQGDLLAAVFRRDWRYWAVARLFKRRLMGLMGASEAVVAGLAPGQLELVDRVIDQMNPVAPRAAGVAFDNTAALPGRRVAAVRAPTLILHARDDSLQLYRNAEFAAAAIPGARLIGFEHGGHLLVAVEQEAIRTATQRHVRDHHAPPARARRQSSDAAHSRAVLSSSMSKTRRRPPMSHPNALAACRTQSTSVTTAQRCQSPRWANPSAMSSHSAPAV
jgi:pimeloyl-ACP methyl ester carboxylesterase